MRDLADYDDFPVGERRLEPWIREHERQQRGEPLKSDPNRHHFVPECYLGRFGKMPDDSVRKRQRSNPKPRVARVDVTTGETIEVSVRHAATETGLYTVVGDEPKEVEHVIGIFETCVGYAFEALDKDPNHFPDRIDRRNLAHFMALQAVRGPETREALADIQTAMLRGVMMMHAESPDLVRAQLARHGDDSSDESVAEMIEVLRAQTEGVRVAPDNNEATVEILRAAVDFMPFFYMRNWTIMRSDEVPLLTTDQPVVRLDARLVAWHGVGLGNAETLAIALDRRRLLLMHQREGAEKVIAAPPSLVRQFNSLAPKLARRWYFHHPDDDFSEVAEGLSRR